MDPADILIVLLMFLGISVPAGLASAWYVARRRVRDLEAQLRGGEFSADDRVEALERHVEALADQVEQLASGQEFLNRLVAKQAQRLPAAEPARVTTPV